MFQRSLRRILGIRWFDHVTNLEVKDRTRLEDIESRVRRRRLALFGHVARMQPDIPAHDALWTAIGARCGNAPGPGWKRPRGQKRVVGGDTGLHASNMPKEGKFPPSDSRLDVFKARAVLHLQICYVIEPSDP